MSLSPFRAGKVGSSDVAALFGQSRWLTRMGLWHQLRTGKERPRVEDERMRWGRLLQSVILEEVAVRRGWEVELNANDSWVDHPDASLRCGATVDAWVRRHELGLGLVECKCVDSMEWRFGAWADGRPPADTELQLQHQLWVTGASWGVIAVLVGGNSLELLERRAKPKVHAALERELRSFWLEVEEGRRPVETAEDVPILAELLEDAVPGAPAFRALDDMELAQACADLAQAQDMKRTAEAVIDAAKAKILARVQGAGETLAPYYRVKVSRSAIAAGTVQRPAHVRATITLKPDENLVPAQREHEEYRA